MPRPMPIRPGAAGIGVVLTLVLLWHAGRWAFLCDDAYISFRYAEHWARWGAPRFNPGEAVEGYTNFLWVALLAVGAVLGAPAPALAPWLTQASGVALLWISAALCRVARGGRELAVPDWAPAVLLLMWPEFVVWLHGGLETSFAVALGLGALLCLQTDRLRTAPLLAAAAALARPDASLYIVAFGATWVGMNRDVAVRTRGRRLLVWGLVAAAIVVLHVLWRRWFYGAWLPNTWAVKSHGHSLWRTWGVAYAGAWAAGVGLVWLTPLVAGLRRGLLPHVAAVSTVAGYSIAVGGDFMAYGRFMLPATVLLAVIAGAAAAALSRRRFGAPVVVIVFAASLGVGVFESRARAQLDRNTPQGWIDGRWEGVTAMREFARVRVVAGRWMRDNLPAETLVSVGAAGAMPYASDLPTLDTFGLVDPAIAHRSDARVRHGKRARPGHQVSASAAYVAERDPDLLCHVGFHGGRTPTERQAHPRYRRGYRWACVGPDQTGDDSAGYYCCRRPVARAVGPFGAREGGT